LPLEARLAAASCRGGEGLVRALFEPLGYRVESERIALDERFPAWGRGPHFALVLSRACTLREMLAHLYVLIPVLDDDKHYWVGEDEVEKLLRHGEGWLESHPEKELIARRYLKHQPRLTREALARLVADDGSDPDAEACVHAEEEAAIEETVSLNQARQTSVLGELRASGAKTVLDLGCGEGKLMQMLVREKSFERIVGIDVSLRSLEVARDRLNMERLSGRKAERISLLHGSLLYRDERLFGFDAAACVEVIEHLEPFRLGAFERVLFAATRPRVVVLTTPNAEYNVRFASLPAGRMRHKDHRFEWTRAEFEAWARGVGERHGYGVRFEPVGPMDEAVGAPTQMAVFSR
jgi:3' terminal RNA ribose 2'-O-methyltransferase Hen1